MEVNITTYEQYDNINNPIINTGEVLILDDNGTDIPIGNETTITINYGAKLVINSGKLVDTTIHGNNGSIVVNDTLSYVFDNCTFTGNFVDSKLYATNFGCKDNLGLSDPWTWNWEEENIYVHQVQTYIDKYDSENPYDNFSYLQNMFNAAEHFTNTDLILNGSFYTDYSDDGQLNNNVLLINNLNNINIKGLYNNKNCQILTGLKLESCNNVNISNIDFVGLHTSHEFPVYDSQGSNGFKKLSNGEKTLISRYTNNYPYKMYYDLFGTPYNSTVDGYKSVGIAPTAINMRYNNTNIYVNDCNVTMRHSGVGAGYKYTHAQETNSNWQTQSQYDKYYYYAMRNQTNIGTYINNCTFSYILYQPIGTHGRFTYVSNCTSYYCMQGIDFSEQANNCYVYNSKLYGNFIGFKCQSIPDNYISRIEVNNGTVTYYAKSLSLIDSYLSYNNKIDNIYYEISNKSYYDIVHGNDNIVNHKYGAPMIISSGDATMRMPYTSMGRKDTTNIISNTTIDINAAYMPTLWKKPFHFRHNITYLDNVTINNNWSHVPSYKKQGNSYVFNNNVYETGMIYGWKSTSHSDADILTYFYKNPIQYKGRSVKMLANVLNSVSNNAVPIIDYDQINFIDLGGSNLKGPETTGTVSVQDGNYTRSCILETGTDPNYQFIDYNTAYLYINNCNFNITSPYPYFINSNGGDDGNYYTYINNTSVKLQKSSLFSKDYIGNVGDSMVKNNKLLGLGFYSFTNYKTNSDITIPNKVVLDDIPVHLNNFVVSNPPFGGNSDFSSQPSNRPIGLGRFVNVNGNNFVSYIVNDDNNTTTYMSTNDAVIFNSSLINIETINGVSTNTLHVPNKMIIPKDVTLSNLKIIGNNSNIIVEPDENNLHNHIVFGNNVTFEGTFAYSYMKASYFGMIDGLYKEDYYWEWTDNRHVKTHMYVGPKGHELDEYSNNISNTNGLIKNKIESFLLNSYAIDFELDGDYMTNCTSVTKDKLRIYEASYLNIHGTSNDDRCNTLFSIYLYGCDNTEISYVNFLGYHGVHEYPTIFSNGNYWANPKVYKNSSWSTTAQTCKSSYPYKGIIELFGDPCCLSLSADNVKDEYKFCTSIVGFGVQGRWGMCLMPNMTSHKIIKYQNPTNDKSEIVTNIKAGQILRFSGSVQVGSGVFTEGNAANHYNYTVNPNPDDHASNSYIYDNVEFGKYIGLESSYYYVAFPVIKLNRNGECNLYDHMSNTTIKLTNKPLMLPSYKINRISIDSNEEITTYMWCDGKKYYSTTSSRIAFPGNDTDIDTSKIGKYMPTISGSATLASTTVFNLVERSTTQTKIHDCHVEMRQGGIAIGEKESHIEVYNTYIYNCTFDHIFYQPVGSHGGFTYIDNVDANYCLQGFDVSTGANNFYVKNSTFDNCVTGFKTASNDEYAEYSYNVNIDNIKYYTTNKLWTSLGGHNPYNPGLIYIGTSLYNFQTERNTPKTNIRIKNSIIEDNLAYVPATRNVFIIGRSYLTSIYNSVITNGWSWDFAKGERTTEHVTKWINNNCTSVNVDADVDLITVSFNGKTAKLPIKYNENCEKTEYDKRYVIESGNSMGRLYNSKLLNGKYNINYTTPTIIFNNSCIINSTYNQSIFAMQSNSMNYVFNNTYLIYDNPYKFNTTTQYANMTVPRYGEQYLFLCNGSQEKLSYTFNNFYVPQPGIESKIKGTHYDIVPVKYKFKNKTYNFTAKKYYSSKYISPEVKQRYHLDRWGYNEFPQDTIPMYYGGRRERRKWIEPELENILKHTFTNGNSDWFFRSFLYFDFWINKNANGAWETAHVFSDNQQSKENPPATKVQWETFINEYFSEKRYNASINSTTKLYDYTQNDNGQYHEGLRALDEKIESLKIELGEPNFKHKVILGIPLPCTNFTEWGSIDNEVMDFRIKEHRIKATKWIIDKLIKTFNEKNYKNIVLDGIYWLDETTSVLNWKKDKNGEWTIYKIDSNGNRLSGFDYVYENGVRKQNDIIYDIANYLYCKYDDLTFYWIPYNGAYGNETDDWKKKFNFSRCETQTGYFWNTPEHPGHSGSTAMTTTQLQTLCNNALLYDKGIQIEISRFLFKSHWDSEQPTGYDIAPTFDSTNTYSVNLYNRINTLLNIFEQMNIFNTKKINVCYYFDNYAALNLFGSNNSTIKTLADRIASHIILRNTL